MSNSLNKAVKISSGNYIVRMDSDDICYQNRFEYLLSYMNKIKISISCFQVWNILVLNFFLKHSASQYDNKEIGTLLNYYNPLNHPTFIAKSKVLKNINILADLRILKIGIYGLLCIKMGKFSNFR